MKGARTGLLRQLLGFEGRLRRRDWWGLNLFIGFVQIALIVTLTPLLFGPQTSFLGTATVDGWRLVADGPWWFATLVSVSATWPFAALAAKRAHDHAWKSQPVIAATIFSMVVSLFPHDLGFIAGVRVDEGDWAYLVPIVLQVISLIVGFVLLITLGFMDGTPGPNRYGPSPKGLGRVRPET